MRTPKLLLARSRQRSLPVGMSGRGTFAQPLCRHVWAVKPLNQSVLTGRNAKAGFELPIERG